MMYEPKRRVSLFLTSRLRQQVSTSHEQDYLKGPSGYVEALQKSQRLPDQTAYGLKLGYDFPRSREKMLHASHRNKGTDEVLTDDTGYWRMPPMSLGLEEGGGKPKPRTGYWEGGGGGEEGGDRGERRGVTPHPPHPELV